MAEGSDSDDNVGPQPLRNPTATKRLDERAEEKRGILKLQREERERREAVLREEFSELVNEKLKATSGQAAGPSKE